MHFGKISIFTLIILTESITCGTYFFLYDKVENDFIYKTEDSFNANALKKSFITKYKSVCLRMCEKIAAKCILAILTKINMDLFQCDLYNTLPLMKLNEIVQSTTQISELQLFYLKNGLKLKIKNLGVPTASCLPMNTLDLSSYNQMVMNYDDTKFHGFKFDSSVSSTPKKIPLTLIDTIEFKILYLNNVSIQKFVIFSDDKKIIGLSVCLINKTNGLYECEDKMGETTNFKYRGVLDLNDYNSKYVRFRLDQITHCSKLDYLAFLITYP
ncbi:unnamed protein product [Brachionus calyciflorus]|uniref:Uncharacterized protein n=1 Tax=Brachionus calyciflorus TaxID=104777 RepID=A0A813R4H4_9BILA|nr:unnamed protein product [Brachionus calyciflorus]